MIAVYEEHDKQTLYELSLKAIDGRQLTYSILAETDEEALKKANNMLKPQGECFHILGTGILLRVLGKIVGYCYLIHLIASSAGHDVCSGYQCFMAHDDPEAERIFDAINWHHKKQIYGLGGILKETLTVNV